MQSFYNNLSQAAKEDVAKSGIDPEYVEMLKFYPPTSHQLQILGQQANSDGYIIPYFALSGRINNLFFRQKLLPPIKLSDGWMKYQQPKNSPNHLYIPPNFLQNLSNPLSSSAPSSASAPSMPLLVIVEGEKKAASISQPRFSLPSIGLGGVDNWRTSKIALSKKYLIAQSDEELIFENNSGSNNALLTEVTNRIAPEFSDLFLLPQLNQQHEQQRKIVILFDYDPKPQTRENTNRAAFELALFLQTRGFNNVVAGFLPPLRGRENEKWAVDDFVREGGTVEQLVQMMQEFKFPSPNDRNMKSWVNKLLLAEGKMERMDRFKLVRGIIAHMDNNGQRYKNPKTGQVYYFHNDSRILYELNMDKDMTLRAGLGLFLYRQYGMHTSDSTVLNDFLDMFINHEGIEPVEAYKILYQHPNGNIYFQATDQYLLKISAEKIELRYNGHDGVLFSSVTAQFGEQESIDVARLVEILREEKAKTGAELNQWNKTLRSSSIRALPGLDINDTITYLSIVFYMNPWLNRWKGTMLPLELTIAEPGSGKSMLYNLRQGILTGAPKLSGMPLTLRDWVATISSQGGIWVGDNFGSGKGVNVGQLSDELARIITDPNPSVDMRKLYTTAENISVPVRCTFAITAINNPFNREDLLQRSIVIKLAAIPAGMRDGNWYQRQLSGEGRMRWLANHLIVLQRFLSLSAEGWNNNYKSVHRLVNYEQSVIFMAKVLGVPQKSIDNIVSSLTKQVSENISSDNPIIAALQEYAEYWRRTHKGRNVTKFTCQDIVEWVQVNTMSYGDIDVLKNPRKLGKYMMGHLSDIKAITGIEEHPVEFNNRRCYYINYNSNGKGE